MGGGRPPPAPGRPGSSSDTTYHGSPSSPGGSRLPPAPPRLAGRRARPCAAHRRRRGLSGRAGARRPGLFRPLRRGPVRLGPARARIRAELEALSDRELADIGVTRGEIGRVLAEAEQARTPRPAQRPVGLPVPRPA
ncbi:DUF1127 domain-containing protein [Roseicella sp. DB1501]|nr:DUF1127 domain-containing protein [Roseicella sp. DB1501]